MSNINIINNCKNNLTLTPLINNTPNICANATEEFTQIYQQLESMEDLKERADLASKTIEKNDCLKTISFSLLGEYLKSPALCPISLWRELYLIERSIKPVTKTKYSWFDRLKLFYNTYVDEKNVVGTKYLNSKFYYMTYHDTIDHEVLHYGPGKDVPDFYYFDNSLSGTVKEKMVKVDLKYSVFPNVELAIQHYRDHHNHSAQKLLIHQPNVGYFLADCLENVIVQLVDIAEPKKEEIFLLNKLN